MQATKKIAVLVSFSGQGGVERSFALLMNELVARGIAVDLLLIKSNSPHLSALSPNIRQIPLKNQHAATCVGEVAAYLAREQPSALLVAKHRAILASIKAKKRAKVDTPLYGVIGINVSQSLENRSAVQRWQWYWLMRRHYPKLTGLIGVSEGVAADLRSITGMTDDQVTAIKNPVTTDAMLQEASYPVDHRWLADDFDEPVLITVGRLTKNKDHGMLLRAFGRINAERPSRLLILGEGPERSQLESQITALQLQDRVELAGFVDRPWAWMAKADLFVLSSFAEGSGNVLTEAMAVGTAVVSTDCPSGPSEMLDGGKVAPLVPVGDDKALAEACLSVLSSAAAPEVLARAVAPFTAAASAENYLKFMRL